MKRHATHKQFSGLLNGALFIALTSTSALAQSAPPIPDNGITLTQEQPEGAGGFQVSPDPLMAASGMPPEMEAEIIRSDMNMIFEANNASDELKRSVLIAELAEMGTVLEVDSLSAEGSAAPQPVEKVEEAPKTSPTVGMEIKDGEDPIARQAEELLRQDGIIKRQSDIGSSILLLERQAAQAQAIANLIQLKGPEAKIEIAPGVFETFEDTPTARRLAIDLAKLEEKPAPSADTKPPAAGALRSDGTSFQELPQVRSPAALAPTPVAPVSASISLREVFGVNGEYQATVRVGTDLVRVVKGDDLPGGVEVIEIGPDYILLDRNGRESRVSLRG